MKFLGVFVAGVAVGLAVSWAYILSLRAAIRVCMTYIEGRICDCTYDSGGAREAARTDHRSASSPELVALKMAEKLRLPTERPGKNVPRAGTPASSRGPSSTPCK